MCRLHCAFPRKFFQWESKFLLELILADRKEIHKIKYRLQNSPYFCVFKYARAVKQKVWNEAENRERDWGETLKVSHYGRVRLARFARVRLLRHALLIF